MGGLSNKELREHLTEAHSLLCRLNEKIIDDHQEEMLLPTYADYAKHAPSVYLDRALAKLQKKGYRVAFAGAMKAGKSTLINALLRAPELLPAAVYECTLSTTRVGAPAPGQQERVEVSYFTRDSAIQNLLHNLRYEELFVNKEEVLEPFDGGAALRYIRKKSRDAASDSEKLEQVGELNEFCEAIEKFKTRLGTVHIDSLDNASQYLTVDLQQRDGTSAFDSTSGYL